MIQADAKLTIKKVPLACISCNQYEVRYVEKLLTYIDLLKKHPNAYVGMLFLEPSPTHAGIYALLDGYHKFCASIMAGRKDALAVVIEE